MNLASLLELERGLSRHWMVASPCFTGEATGTWRGSDLPVSPVLNAENTRGTGWLL